MTSLLIDADVIAYRASFATEKTKYLCEVPFDSTSSNVVYADDAKTAKEAGGTIWTRKEVQPVETALMIVDTMLRDIYDHYASESPSVSCFLSGIGNYRYSIATRASYKSGRPTAPVHLKAVRQHLIDKHAAIVSSGEEADDLLGIAMTNDKTAVCASIDKDLKQLPGRHYNFVAKEETIVSPREAVLNFYSQVLSGDSTDNIPGIAGIGPVKARKMLEGCKNPAECWTACVIAYDDAFGVERGAAYALECARLVFVRRKVWQMFSPPPLTVVQIFAA